MDFSSRGRLQKGKFIALRSAIFRIVFARRAVLDRSLFERPSLFAFPAFRGLMALFNLFTLLIYTSYFILRR